MLPARSYIIACTPRCGSHLLADGLTSSGIAGLPVERFPRFTPQMTFTVAARDAMVTEPPPESSYDPVLDAAYIKQILEEGTSANGVFGVAIHWFQINDAVRRLRSYSKSEATGPHAVLSGCFPDLSYIWLRRHDKVAQAVSWYKAIRTGRYVKTRGGRAAKPGSAGAMEFDYSTIKTYWTALRSAENGWQRYFAANGLQPHVLEYEVLCNDFEGSVRKALAFLGLSAGQAAIAAPRHQKAADAQSFEWVERFKPLLAANR